MEKLIVLVTLVLFAFPVLGQDCQIEAEYQNVERRDSFLAEYFSEGSVFIKNVSPDTLKSVGAAFILLDNDNRWLYADVEHTFSDVAPGNRKEIELGLFHNWEFAGYDVRFSQNGGEDLLIVCENETTGKQDVEFPERLDLSQNYPNPFNPQTTIEYSLAQGANVRLAIYDMMGREVEVLVNGHRPAGKHTVRFDASHLASGSYLYRIRTETYTATKTMTLHR